MPSSAQSPKNKKGSGFPALRVPAQVLQVIKTRVTEDSDDSRKGADSASIDVELSTGIDTEIVRETASEEIPEAFLALSATDVRRSLFGDPPEVVAAIKDRVRIASDTFSPIDLDDLPKRLIATPDSIPSLPVLLQPWGSILQDWAKFTEDGKSAQPFTDRTLCDCGAITVSGPMLPPGYQPWLISVATDPGPFVTGRGHTCLLLAASPSEWSPGLRETLRGVYGDRIIVRLDALLCRIPKPWWDVYAYGAYEKGALYFVAP